MFICWAVVWLLATPSFYVAFLHLTCTTTARNISTHRMFIISDLDLELMMSELQKQCLGIILDFIVTYLSK